jgi:hypothetical protein
MKLLLLACFFSPLLTVGIIYWRAAGGELKNLEALAQPFVSTVLLFWIWQSAGSRLSHDPLAE